MIHRRIGRKASPPRRRRKCTSSKKKPIEYDGRKKEVKTEKSIETPNQSMTTKLYQIKEEDLAILEAELPRLLDAAYATCNDTLIRKRWQEIKKIVSNVRWNYGPPLEVKQV